MTQATPQAADPIERFSCRPDFCVLMCPWPNKQTIDEFPLSKESPPAFIAHARDDQSAPLSFALAIDEKLKGLGAKNKLFVVDSGGHSAFHCGVVEGPGVSWPETLLAWLKQIEMWRDTR